MSAASHRVINIENASFIVATILCSHSFAILPCLGTPALCRELFIYLFIYLLAIFKQRFIFYFSMFLFIYFLMLFIKEYKKITIQYISNYNNSMHIFTKRTNR